MAVYTHLSDEAIAAWLHAHYAIGTLQAAQGIAQGVENSNYLLTVSHEHGSATRYILTIYEKRVATDELPFFLELMQHLARRGIHCPLPVPRRDGLLYGALAGKQAALVTFLDGQSRTEIAPPHSYAAGMALAQLHQASEGFPLHRDNDLSLSGWRGLADKLLPDLDKIHLGLQKTVRDELAYLQQHFPSPETLPRGVIHADYFPDNVFFNGDAVSGIIDFYFACHDFLVYDLAIAINAWCFDLAPALPGDVIARSEATRQSILLDEEEGGLVGLRLPSGRGARHDGVQMDTTPRFNADKTQQLIAGYCQIRSLTPAERAALPTLLRAAALRFLLTRAHDWLHRDPDALVTAKDPLEYLAKLQFFQQHQGDFSYGI